MLLTPNPIIDDNQISPPYLSQILDPWSLLFSSPSRSSFPKLLFFHVLSFLQFFYYFMKNNNIEVSKTLLYHTPFFTISLQWPKCHKPLFSIKFLIIQIINSIFQIKLILKLYGRYNSPPLKEFSSSKTNLKKRVPDRNLSS